MAPAPRRLAFALAFVLAACSSDVDPAPAVHVAGYEPLRAGLLRWEGWRTDPERTTVPLTSIGLSTRVSRDDFVPITAPRFAPAAEVTLADSEPVLVHLGAEGVRAWPLVHLLRRELARDTVDGVPVAVTLCSLCASARVWDVRLDGRTLELGVSGMLQRGNGLLYDRGTESLWRQLDGLAVAGAHAGRRLRHLPAFTVSFGALRAAHPEARVMLAPEDMGQPPFAMISAEEVQRGVPPRWLRTTCPEPLALVLSAAAHEEGVVVIRDPATAPVHRADGGGVGQAIGSAAAFRRELDGDTLTFRAVPEGVVDRETGSRWSPLGEAVEGPLRGRRLEPVPHVRAFRFAQ